MLLLHCVRLAARGLDSRQQQSDKDADDSNHYQELD